ALAAEAVVGLRAGAAAAAFDRLLRRLDHLPAAHPEADRRAHELGLDVDDRRAGVGHVERDLILARQLAAAEHLGAVHHDGLLAEAAHAQLHGARLVDLPGPLERHLPPPCSDATSLELAPSPEQREVQPLPFRPERIGVCAQLRRIAVALA